MRSCSEKRDSEVHLTVESVTGQALELKIRKVRGNNWKTLGITTGSQVEAEEAPFSPLDKAKGVGGRGGRQVQVPCRCLGHSLGSRL